MNTYLRGLGIAAPEVSIGQTRLAVLAKSMSSLTARQDEFVSSVFEGTKIDLRGSVLFRDGPEAFGEMDFYTQASDRHDGGPTTGDRMARYLKEAPALAFAASKRALAQAEISPDDVAHLVMVSCTGFAAPGVDIALIEELGLRKTISRSTIGFMGCHGAINGLRVVDGLCQRHPDDVVLLCAVELCSLHYAYRWHAQRVVANALFADGAGALVCSGKSGGLGWRLIDTGSYLMSSGKDAMSWYIGDHGFEMTLDREVPKLIEKHLPGWLTSWLAPHGLTINDIGGWAVHPGGPAILQSVKESLQLSDAQMAPSYDVLSQHGNMSSPTVLFILDQLRRSHAFEKSEAPYVMLAFGPGLAAEIALIQPNTRSDTL